MALPGGAAGKAGDVYEAKVGVRSMVGLLHGRDLSLCIEPPGYHWAEFYTIAVNGSRTYYQVKRSGVWTIGNFASYLTNADLELQGGHRFLVFCGDGFPELSELVFRAKKANDLTSFTNTYAKADSRRGKHFDAIASYWGTNPLGTLKRLQTQIVVQSMDEGNLDEYNRSALFSYCGEDAQTAQAVLLQFYLETSDECLDRALVLAKLRDHGLLKRVLVLGAWREGSQKAAKRAAVALRGFAYTWVSEGPILSRGGIRRLELSSARPVLSPDFARLVHSVDDLARVATLAKWESAVTGLQQLALEVQLRLEVAESADRPSDTTLKLERWRHVELQALQDLISLGRIELHLEPV